jgi:hypothetical protein
MSGSVYVLSREVKGDSGERYTQVLTVYAGNATDARDLARREFARWRMAGVDGAAYAPMPEFDVDRVLLDEPKLITAGMTK